MKTVHVKKYWLPKFVAKWVEYPGFLWRPYGFFMGLAVVLYLAIAGVADLLIALFLFPFHKLRVKLHEIVYRGFMAATVKFFRIDLTIHFSEKIDWSKNYLYTANHESFLDIPLSAYKAPHFLKMIGKIELAFLPFFGWSIYFEDHIIINRGKQSSRIKVAKQLLQKLKNGESAWLAPEGTRTRTGELGEFKSGSFAVATQAGVDVVPIAIEGAREALPPGKLCVKSGAKMEVWYLDPVSTAGKSSSDRRELAAQARQQIKDKLL